MMHTDSSGFMTIHNESASSFIHWFFFLGKKRRFVIKKIPVFRFFILDRLLMYISVTLFWAHSSWVDTDVIVTNYLLMSTSINQLESAHDVDTIWVLILLRLESDGQISLSDWCWYFNYADVSRIILLNLGCSAWDHQVYRNVLSAAYLTNEYQTALTSVDQSAS